MHRIAVFSDVHGNLPALEAVLQAIDAERPDAVVCLGDLVDFAPWPNEVIDVLRARAIPTLMGNHDERIAFDLELTPIAKHGPEERAARVLAIDWSRRNVRPAGKTYLAGLPRSLRLSFASRELLFVHASTCSLDEYIYEDHREPELEAMFAASGADVIVMGHTHLPYVRQVGRCLAVNAGSVGRSKEPSRMPSFAILQVDGKRVEAEIHRVAYEWQRTASAIYASEIPDFYADFLAASSRV